MSVYLVSCHSKTTTSETQLQSTSDYLRPRVGRVSVPVIMSFHPSVVIRNFTTLGISYPIHCLALRPASPQLCVQSYALWVKRDVWARSDVGFCARGERLNDEWVALGLDLAPQSLYRMPDELVFGDPPRKFFCLRSTHCDVSRQCAYSRMQCGWSGMCLVFARGRTFGGVMDSASFLS